MPVSARILTELLGPMPKMYGSAYWIFLSRGKSTPAIRAMPLPNPVAVYAWGYACKSLSRPGPAPQLAGSSGARARSPVSGPAVTKDRHQGSGARRWSSSRPRPRHYARTRPAARGGRRRTACFGHTRAARAARAAPTEQRTRASTYVCLIPSIERFDQALVRSHRVARGGDRPANHQVRGATPHGFRRFDGADLIAGRFPGRANARHHDPGISAERLAQQSKLLAGRDNTAQPGVQSRARQALGLEPHVGYTTPQDTFDLGGVVRREDGDTNNRKVGVTTRRVRRGRQHRATSQAMHRRHRYAQLARRGHRTRHDVGDVVPLEIQEHANAALAEFLDE